MSSNNIPITWGITLGRWGGRDAVYASMKPRQLPRRAAHLGGRLATWIPATHLDSEPVLQLEFSSNSGFWMQGRLTSGCHQDVS